MNTVRRFLTLLLWGMAFAILAFVLVIVMAKNGIYPSGADTLSYIYKGDVLYKALGRGQFDLIYDPLWFNGVEFLRYQGPLPVYLLALCQMIGGGDPFIGYLVFVWIVFVAGGLVFSYIGMIMERPVMGGVAGLLWFFMPCNMYTLFSSGNLPASICSVLLPLFIYHMERYLREGKVRRLIYIAILMVLTGLCRFDWGGMLIAVGVVFMFIYSLMNHSLIRGLIMVLDLAGSFMLTGLWLVPCLSGNLAESPAEKADQYFQSAWISLDPMNWFINGADCVYFSAAVFVLIIFGILCSKKESQPEFATAMLIFLGTTTTGFYFFKMLPFTQNVWMLEYVPIAVGLVLYALINWSSLKKPVQMIVVVLLALDCLCGWSLIAGYGSNSTPSERFAQMEEDTLIREAKKITKQRVALMDLGRLGPEGVFMLGSRGTAVASAYGSNWERAATASNILQLNRSLESGQHRYLFDRCLEMGCDSVLIRMDCIPDTYGDFSELESAAAQSGYSLAASNDRYRLYHRETNGGFGTVNRYGAIGIGSGAGDISLTFPDVEETTEDDLCKYTFEELSGYRTVYLNGFTCSDYKQAEDLVKRLADSGVRVVILADGMPEDPSNKQKSFLGVFASSIKFSNGYPELLVHGKYINTDLFAQGYSKWETVFLTGMDKTYGQVEEDDIVLDFYGSTYNDNILFLGINLSYHYALTRDRSVEGIMEECFGIDAGRLPQRQVVPLDIESDGKSVTISSQADGVNSAIAALEGTDEHPRNNLIFVNKGKTVINIRKPGLIGGGIVSAFGLVLCVSSIFAAACLSKKCTKNVP
ncbi:MAG: hypothetical protein IJM34_00065 [Lachnospiraceae bacterium]|nr:hypothetical protein [Lachnospiraceae bacterium]